MEYGYESLKAKVKKDCEHKEDYSSQCDYCKKFDWIIDRAKKYEKYTGLPWEKILSSWEKQCNYWYMNYYQEANQPENKEDGYFRVFETIDELKESVGTEGFICPACSHISKNPYECDKCNWNICGLLGDLNKGNYIFCKDKVLGEKIFRPVTWENKKD